MMQGESLPAIPVALPDVDGMFAPPASLYVNDAAWLPSDGARLVHPAVPLHAAETLGARSLRFHHQVCRWQEMQHVVANRQYSIGRHIHTGGGRVGKYSQWHCRCPQTTRNSCHVHQRLRLPLPWKPSG
jgi:hypothetical protein